MATPFIVEVAIGPCVPQPYAELNTLGLIHSTHKDTVQILTAPKVVQLNQDYAISSAESVFFTEKEAN